MDVEDLGRPPRQIEHGKHTAPFPDDLQEMKEKYQNLPTQNKSHYIDQSDLLTLFDRYSKTLTENLYTIAEALDLNISSLHRMLQKKEVKELFAPYKARRQKLYSEEMMRCAMGPITKIRRGEEVALFEVKASDLAAKYCAFMAKSTDPDLGAAAHEDGQVQVQINTLVQVKDFSVSRELEDKKEVIDVEPKEEDGEDC